MFTVEELAPCLNDERLRPGFRLVSETILRHRIGIDSRQDPSEGFALLARFSQAVLASVADWGDTRQGGGNALCLQAADVEMALALRARQVSSPHLLHTLHAALLYDLAGLPGVAAAIVKGTDLSDDTEAFFSRAANSLWGAFQSTHAESESETVQERDHLGSTDLDVLQVVNEAIAEVLCESAKELRSRRPYVPATASEAFASLVEMTSAYNLGISGDAIRALTKAVEVRNQYATSSAVAQYEDLNPSTLAAIGAPVELWPVQRGAIQAGLLHNDVQSFGLAAPTGTGKTALTKVLLAHFFNEYPEKKAIYISPSRALTAQIARDLQAALTPVGISVAALGASLTFHERVFGDSRSANLLIFTPEKADLILRIEPEIIAATSLVIVDEAHHIEQSDRGMLLEFYLWRLKSIIPANARVIQLSAVAPNIGELVGWLGSAESSVSVRMNWRTNRLRLGRYERDSGGAGVLHFDGHKATTVIAPSAGVSDPVIELAHLAEALSSRGIILVLATSPAKAEAIAAAISSLRGASRAPTGLVAERLDARIERELFEDSPLREMGRRRVAYHHAELPPRVRTGIEEAVSAKQIDIVCATTTLAEGVNFPFSTVIVQSLVGQNYEISPRSLWNIAGRAGRFGVDSEGHCILFRPSTWARRLKRFQLDDYFVTDIADIPPVKSALGCALSDLKNAVQENHVDFNSLSSLRLDGIKADPKSDISAKRIRGLINVMRVSYAHASATNTINLNREAAPEFIENELLATRQMEPDTKIFAERVGVQQRNVIRETLEQNEELVRIAARIGWALETQSGLYEWLRRLDDWQLEQFGHLVLGGRIVNIDRLGYLIGPLASRMAEFNGETLGGYTSFVAVRWLEGLPLTAIRNAQDKKPTFNRLVHLIYSRVQYLLPWGLYGLHELLMYEANRRSLQVGSGVKDLSVLAAEGVRSFDALRLVLELDVERVDATRIAESYHRAHKRGTDIVGWLRGTSWETLVGIVRGFDRRRLDPDLRSVWEFVRSM